MHGGGFGGSVTPKGDRLRGGLLGWRTSWAGGGGGDWGSVWRGAGGGAWGGLAGLVQYGRVLQLNGAEGAGSNGNGRRAGRSGTDRTLTGRL